MLFRSGSGLLARADELPFDPVVDQARFVQQHLPLLDEAVLIDYRIERQFIGPSEKTRTALPYLELALTQVSATEIDEE